MKSEKKKEKSMKNYRINFLFMKSEDKEEKY